MNYKNELERHKTSLTKQQYKTLQGQLRVGECEPMLRGLNKILGRVNNGR